jgi:hypothetical protein
MRDHIKLNETRESCMSKLSLSILAGSSPSMGLKADNCRGSQILHSWDAAGDDFHETHYGHAELKQLYFVIGIVIPERKFQHDEASAER